MSLVSGGPVERNGISNEMVFRLADLANRSTRIGALEIKRFKLVVLTILELAQRNPEHLYQKVIEANEEHHHVRHVPSQSQIEDWVNQAKELPRVVSY